ncbi:glycosyltransferase family 9 protein [Sinomonas halotolerans]|uniref:Glycosyltransferase family 9 protein n=1 Tax=Sinomonas halotolerans TaxID=1644133 RepID=A0ABU9X0C2_9MICC
MEHEPRFEGVDRIAVLRGGGIGDLVGALPALAALRAAYPGAETVLLTTPLLAGLLEGRPSLVDRTVPVPLFPDAVGPGGVRWWAHAPTLALLSALRAEGIDLAVQLHGGGRNTNPFVLALGATHTVGCATDDAAALERSMPHAFYQRELDRWLEVAALAGAPSAGHVPHFAATAADAAAARPWLDPACRGLVVVHPGATDARRRWPAERFAAVAADLAADGWQVLVVGDDGERGLAEEVARAASEGQGPGVGSVQSAAGRTSLAALVGLLAAARLVVANDSGPRHLAEALGTPTASVYWAPNVVNAGPVGRRLNRVQIAWRSACPVCGRDGTDPFAEACGHTVPWVEEVPVHAVLADAKSLLAGRRAGRGG